MNVRVALVVIVLISTALVSYADDAGCTIRFPLTIREQLPHDRFELLDNFAANELHVEIGGKEYAVKSTRETAGLSWQF